ncbi:MAG: branched-chain amino acid ABC transporter substrate-binding protein [Elusimicrobia bacterium]|nr:branched-chain amino acid ABC transporter substrate-binding protein [Elusimicrobiota bacterium]
MRKFTLSLLAIGLLTSCQRGPREVKIAIAEPLTGDIAALGQGLKRAAVLAIEEANASGRFPEFKLRAVEFDDRSDPKEAVNVANRIVSNPDIVAVVGHFNSGCSIPASAVYARAGLPMMNAGSSSPQLTLQQLSSHWTGPRNIFRVNTTDDAQGLFAAEFAAHSLKIKTVAILHDKTAYGQGIADVFQEKFKELGGTVLSFDGVQTGDKDFKALVTRIKPLGPELLYFGGTYTEGGLILRQAREAGLQAPYLTGEISYDPDFLRIAGGAAEGAFVTYLGRPPELLDTAKLFIEKYRLAYPGSEVKAYDHYAYEVTNILLSAMEKVGPDKAKIIDALRTLTYEGVLGTTSFDEKGDTFNKTITLFVVKDGKFVPHE